MTGKAKVESDRELPEQLTSDEGTAGLFGHEGRSTQVSTQVRATRARVDHQTQVEVINQPASGRGGGRQVHNKEK